MTLTVENYQPPSAADAQRRPCPAPSKNAPAENSLAEAAPPSADSFASDGEGRLRCTSKTVDPKTGERKTYHLSYRWTPPNGHHRGRLTVASCECKAWERHGACRHMVQADDILNAPPVAASLLARKERQTGPAVIARAGSEVSEDDTPALCFVCGEAAFRIRLYFPPLGYQVVSGCPTCGIWRAV